MSDLAIDGQTEVPLADEGVTGPSAREEWRRHWHQPVIGMIGICGPAIFTYSAGVLMIPMTEEFGWSRAEFSFGLTLASICGLITAPIFGHLVDQVGPRRVALFGVPIAIAYCALLGAVGGSLWQWWALWAGLALVLPMLAPSVWISAVTARFSASRGFAFALALSGTGLAAAIWPPIATYHLSQLGWRLAYPALALTWGLVALPLVIFFFARNGGGVVRASKGMVSGHGKGPGFGRLLFSRTFLLLAGGGSLFAMLTLGMTVHMVSLLQGKGISLLAAGAIAGMIGFCSMVGRLGTGLLLDRMSVRLIGGIALLVPAASSLLLLFGEGQAAVIVAVVMLGLAHGAELDVITYVAARRFARERFASLYAALIAAFTAAASLGPLLAGWLFDQTGGYVAYLSITLPLFAVASLMVVAAEPLRSKAEQG